MCDSEHMFDCPPPSRSSGNSQGPSAGDDKNQQSSHSTSDDTTNEDDEEENHINTLAESITNQGLNANNIDQLIKQVDRVVNHGHKKMYSQLQNY